MIESGIFPEGAIQLICGSAGDLLDHLDLPGRRRVHRLGGDGHEAQESPERSSSDTCASTWKRTRSTTRCSAPTPRRAREEFDLFVKEVATRDDGEGGAEVHRDPAHASCLSDDRRRHPGAHEATRRCKVGDPAVEGVRMGPLAGRAQVGEVGRASTLIARVARAGVRRSDDFDVVGADAAKGAFFPSLLFYCDGAVRDDASRTTSRRSVR